MPNDDPKCKGDQYEGEEPGTKSYEYQRDCPNVQNLIAITGDDDDADRRCDDKCNLQIEGTGRKRPSDVQVVGGGYGLKPGAKLNVFRADRADGVFLRNFLVQYSDFNNVYVIETNGFRAGHVSRAGAASTGSSPSPRTTALYNHVTAYGSGDSGIYPGSGPEGHCERYGIEIRYSESYGNTIGWSGTAGNGVYTHDSNFHHNSTGITMDSFSGGHPGMPQDCSKWESNRIYSNNNDLFNARRDEYCKDTPNEQRDPRKVCPTFQVPVGTGILTGGGNGNIFRSNWIYDNWRRGTMLFWVPGELRGDDPTGQSAPVEHVRDLPREPGTSATAMGIRPDGTPRPERRGLLVGRGGPRQLLVRTTAARGGGAFTSDPMTLFACPSGSPNTHRQRRPSRRELFPCATWDPKTNTDPVGCDWFTRPPEPK